MWIYIFAFVEYCLIAAAAGMLFVAENKADFRGKELKILTIIAMIVWPVFLIGTAYTHWRDKS